MLKHIQKPTQYRQETLTYTQLLQEVDTLQEQVSQQQAQIAALADLLIQVLPQNRLGNVLTLNPGTGIFNEAPRHTQKDWGYLKEWRGR